MKLRYSIVKPYNDLIRVLLAYRLDPGLNALQRGQVDSLFGIKIHAVDPPVLLTCFILNVQDVFAGVGPAIEVDAAEGIVRDWLYLLKVIWKTHPYVHNAVYRSKITNFCTIRTETD